MTGVQTCALPIYRLCSVSGLLLSVLCCIALIHAELRIQENDRLISHSVTFCDNMEGKILRKVQDDNGRWQVMTTSRHWQKAKGRFRYITDFNIFLCNLSLYCGVPVKAILCPGLRDIVKFSETDSNGRRHV